MADTIRAETSKVLIGQAELVEQMLIALLADGHVLIEGVPGVAKTLMAKITARTVSAGFSRIQFTPDLMPSDVTGTSVFNVKSQEFEFHKGPIFSNIVLIDEINRAPAKTQAALFECMQERQITVDGVTHYLSAPFMVIATQNPIEQEGTYRLPEAQLDRFLFKVLVDYPSQNDEVRILQTFQDNQGQLNPLLIETVLGIPELLHFRKITAGIVTEPKLLEYIAAIVYQTRNNRSLYLGASPRASLAVLTSAKARAALKGRDFVIPEDIQYVALPVLRHRILLSPEKEMEGLTPDRIISDIMNSLEVPR
jgi:MoxR-like ATPase